MILNTHSLKCHHNEPSITYSIYLNRFLLADGRWRNSLCDSQWKGCDRQSFSTILRYCLGGMDAVGPPQMPLSGLKDVFSQVPIVQLLWELPVLQEAASTKVMPHRWDSPLPVADSFGGINTCPIASNRDVSRATSASVHSVSSGLGGTVQISTSSSAQPLFHLSSFSTFISTGRSCENQMK